MGLRLATIEDAELILDMSNKFLQSIEYSKYADAGKMKDLVQFFLTSSDKTVILYDNLGMIAAMVNPFLFGVKLVAAEVGWWVEPEHRRSKIGQELLWAFEQWGKQSGCTLATMTSLDDDIGKFYEKNGYRLYERTYIKEL